MKHVAFDLDGVLIDALDIHRWAFLEAWMRLRATDACWMDEAFHDAHLASLSTRQKAQKLASMGIVAPDGLLNLKQELTRERLHEAKPTTPWLGGLIGSLKADGRKVALVSNSIRATCWATLEGNQLLGYFDVVVASDDVVDPKPAPGPYKLAAQRLGVETTALVAFEDSAPGLTAAKAAGCWPYVVTDPMIDLVESKVRAWLKVVDVA